MDVDLRDGRIYSLKGPGGMELIPSEDQVLLSEDFDVINDLRKALSEAGPVGELGSHFGRCYCWILLVLRQTKTRDARDDETI